MSSNKKVSSIIWSTAFALALTACGSSKNNATTAANNSLTSGAGSSFTSPNIASMLAISPSAPSVASGGTVQFTASGGTAPYTFSILNGGGQVDATSGVYTAPTTTTALTAAVGVEDAAGSWAYSSISITVAAATNTASSLAIYPNTVTVVPGGQLQFSASGGVAPYSYSLLQGAQAGGTIGTTTGFFTAPTSQMVLTVQVADSSGNLADAQVTVSGTGGSSGSGGSGGGTPAVTLQTVSTPSQVYVGNAVAFTTTGGTAPYSYSLVSGGGSFNGYLYNAPGTPETATFNVTDSAGMTATFSLPVLAASGADGIQIANNHLDLSDGSYLDFSLNSKRNVIAGFNGEVFYIGGILKTADYKSGPFALDYDGDIMVIGIGKDNALWILHNAAPGLTPTWKRYGGIARSIISVMNAYGTVYVTFVGLDHKPWYYNYNAGLFHRGVPPVPTATTTSSCPTSCSSSGSHLGLNRLPILVPLSRR